MKLKRLFDISATLLSAPIWLPLTLATAILVRISLGRPIFFRQARSGLHGQAFELIKFRTMSDGRKPDGDWLPDHQRLTRLGARLRAASIDELPELFNVLRGDMSLVGPRPLLVQYLERCTPAQRRRHEVNPGITGWCQINGRNALSWEEKFKLDIWYVEHWTLWLDVKILGMTLWKVLRRDGIRAAGHATMPEFIGLDERLETADHRPPDHGPQTGDPASR